MKPKTLILMLVAIGCGLTAAFLATYGGTGATTSNNKQILVAAKTLPAGFVFTKQEETLVYRPYLPDAVPPKAVENFEDLRGKALARTIEANTPVTLNDMSNSQELFRPAPDGYRAMTIQVNVVTSQHGFTLPGSRVDLLCTASDVADARRVWTFTFMENVLVLAVNTFRNQPQDTGGVVPNASTFTLAVKPDDAQKIVWASGKGAISLTLRRPGDEALVKPKPLQNALSEFFDTGDGSSSGTGGTKDIPTVKVWVAKELIMPGKDISNPDDFFELVSFPKALAADAFVETEKEDLKAKVQHLCPKGFPITRQHFKLTAEPAVVGARPARATTVMRVHEGAKPPQEFHFENGRSIEKGPADPREQVPAPAPAPEPGVAPKPTEAPPEKK